MNILDCFKLLFLFHAGTSLQMALKFYYGKKGLSVLRAKTAEETKFSPDTSPSPPKRQSEDESGPSTSKKFKRGHTSSSDEGQQAFDLNYARELQRQELNKFEEVNEDSPCTSRQAQAEQDSDFDYATELQNQELAEAKIYEETGKISYHHSIVKAFFVNQNTY